MTKHKAYDARQDKWVGRGGPIEGFKPGKGMQIGRRMKERRHFLKRRREQERTRDG